MPAPYRNLEVERRDDAWLVRLRNRRMDEHELSEMTDELFGLVREEGCRKLALSLGPEPPQFLYSVFLARLVSLNRLLREQAGSLVLCELRPEVYRIFEACKLDGQFRFARTLADGHAALSSPPS